MSNIYLHATNSIMAILESGKFIGSDKASNKLGEGAPVLDPKTLFVEWKKGNVTESVSRIRESNKDIRGILVFKDPYGKIIKTEKYPMLPGKEVKLDTLSLRAIIAEEGDLSRLKKLYGRSISPLIRGFQGRTFGFYPEPFESILDADKVNIILKEAQLHGCFY